MWPTATLPPRSANSSSPTRPATSNTPATWSPAHRPRTLAVILIDARKGVLTQTRRHSYLAHLLGISSMVLAVNKMDLVNYAQATFDAIVAEYRAFAASIGIHGVTAIPISSLVGDNITCGSANTAWYAGPSLICSPRERRDRRHGRAAAAVSHAGAMGQSSQSGFSRLRRTDFAGMRSTGRRGARAALGQNLHGVANRHARVRISRKRSRANP